MRQQPVDTPASEAQPEEMYGGAASVPRPLETDWHEDAAFVGRVAPERIGLGDPHRFLIHDPAGAQVLVPDLAVAHGPFGESHGLAARSR